MIEAKIITDSESPNKCRLTTFVLKYPRFIHSELMTHRVFSRNSASSRAIPLKKTIEMVENDPAIPIHWGKNQRGMQASEEIDGETAKSYWLQARDNAVKLAKEMEQIGLHKQVANRILEPFLHITVIVSATEFSNFFALRCHPDAQPEFKCLAEKMRDLYLLNQPKQLKVGDWHIPFGDKYIDDISLPHMIKIGVARCARVSYLNFEGDIDYAKDYKLCDDLIESGHFSPTEHVAQCTDNSLFYGNFRGWKQYRKILIGENK